MYIPAPFPFRLPIPNTLSASSNQPLSIAMWTAFPALAVLISSSLQPVVVCVLHILVPIFDGAEINVQKKLFTRMHPNATIAALCQKDQQK